MARFKPGQKVVAIRSHSLGQFKEGEIYIIDGFICCESCAEPMVYLQGYDSFVNTVCNRCKYRMLHNRIAFAERAFAPLANISDAIEYKLKVSIPELTEIKETQLQ